jgi:integrase
MRNGCARSGDGAGASPSHNPTTRDNHGLRHTHATHALAAGVDITVVSTRLGHSRSAFTADTYTRILPEVDRQAAELIARMVTLADEGGAGLGAP